jgi:hypothetical protein
MLSTKCMEVVNYQDKLFWVYRKISKNRIKEEHILEVRNAWHCDTVLKTKNQEEEMLLFLIEISDAIVADFPTPTPISTPELQDPK